MKGKKWVLLFLAIVAVGIGGYMAVSYYANPLGYFTNDKGEPFYFYDDYIRSIKSRYLLEHKDEYDAIIIGGSKTGAYNTDLLTEYSGLRYYNMYLTMGDFADYVRYSRFAVEKVGIKELTLCISSLETQGFDRNINRDNQHKVPSVLKGDLWSRIVEKLSYLMTDVSTIYNTLTVRNTQSLAYADCILDGSMNRREALERFESNPERYITRTVISRFENNMSVLFNNAGPKITNDVYMQNLKALSEIKKLCDSNGVRFQLWINPAGVAERYVYENEEFYRYLEGMVQIVGEAWDFSDYNDINMNPYNSLDAKHFSLEAADLVIRTVYGKESREGFGHVLTVDNVRTWMDRRREDFLKYKQEYEETGTVALEGMDADSYLPWRTEYATSAAADALLHERLGDGYGKWKKYEEKQEPLTEKTKSGSGDDEDGGSADDDDDIAGSGDDV